VSGSIILLPSFFFTTKYVIQLTLILHVDVSDDGNNKHIILDNVHHEVFFLFNRFGPVIKRNFSNMPT
jgi:hypothetical protein